MLKQRIITALVLAILFGGTILFAEADWVVVLFAMALFAASYELQALTIKPGAPAGLAIATGVALLFWFSAQSFGLAVHFYQSLAGLLIWVAILGFLVAYRFSGRWSFTTRLFQFLLGISLLWICVHGLLLIHLHIQHGAWLLLYLLSLVWVADIGAYFSGRKFGKYRLAPGISPGKTWEGAVGGVILNLCWMLIVFQISNGWGMVWWQFLLIGIATSVISVVGDLYESILKREAAVKDSGGLLPGHGGVLDRVDSIIAATPVFISGLYFVGAV